MERIQTLTPIKDKYSSNKFLFGLILNQNQKSERAFGIVNELEKRLGTLEPQILSELDIDLLIEVFQKKPAIHPFSQVMAKNIKAACQILSSTYNSDARNIWKKSSHDQIYNLLIKISGIGPKKAMVGVFLLIHHYKILEENQLFSSYIKNHCNGLYAK